MTAALVLAASAVLGQRFEPAMERLRGFLDRSAAVVIVGLTLAAGIALVVQGATGLWG